MYIANFELCSECLDLLSKDVSELGGTVTVLLEMDSDGICTPCGLETEDTYLVSVACGQPTDSERSFEIEYADGSAEYAWGNYVAETENFFIFGSDDPFEASELAIYRKGEGITFKEI